MINMRIRVKSKDNMEEFKVKYFEFEDNKLSYVITIDGERIDVDNLNVYWGI